MFLRFYKVIRRINVKCVVIFINLINFKNNKDTFNHWFNYNKLVCFFSIALQNSFLSWLGFRTIRGGTFSSKQSMSNDSESRCVDAIGVHLNPSVLSSGVGSLNLAKLVKTSMKMFRILASSLASDNSGRTFGLKFESLHCVT